MDQENKKLKEFHGYLTKDNYDVPDYATFEQTLQDPEKAKVFHNALVNDGYDVPDFETFSSDLGLKKKDLYKSLGFGRDLVQEVFGKDYSPEDKEVSKKPDSSTLPVLSDEIDFTKFKTPDLSLKKTEGNFSFPNNDINDSIARAMLNTPAKEAEPKTIDYITALPQGFNQRMGQTIRNIGAVVNLPKEALAKGIQKITGKTGSANEQYMRQAFADIPILGAFSQENMDQLATAIEKAGNPGAIPNDLIGKTLGSTGSILFDILAVRTPPVTKLNALSKYGMERVPLFPTYLATMEGATAAREGKSLGETAKATAEGLASGLTYEGMGIAAGRAGQLVSELGGGQGLSTASRALANSVMFGADSKLKGGSFMEGFAMGTIFGGYDIAADGIKKSIAHRAYVSWLTATDNNIRNIAKMQVNPTELRKQSDELWTQYEKESDPGKKKELLEEKTEVDNIININAMTQEIVKNPKAFTDAIAKDERLSPKEKTLWTNKIRTTVQNADPRIAEAEPIVADIKKKEGEAQFWQDDQTSDPMVKQAKIESVTTQIDEQKKALNDVLSKPLEDYAPKQEKKAISQTEPSSPEEIAKANKLTYIGKQEGIEADQSDALDMYNVKIKGQQATFTVPAGSDAATVIAKRDAKIKEFGGGQKAPKLKAIKETSRSGKAMNEVANDFEDAVMQFFIGGGRISKQDFIDNSGWGEADIKKSGLGFLLSKSGQKLDTFNEAVPNSFGVQDQGPMDMINRIVEVVKQNPTREKMLDAFEKRRKMDQPFEPTEEEIAMQEADEKFADIVNRNGGLTDKAVDEMIDAGILSREEIETFKENLKNENTERAAAEREWADEEARLRTEQADLEGSGKNFPESEKPDEGKPAEIKAIKFYDALKKNNAPRIQIQDQNGREKLVWDAESRNQYMDTSDETGRKIRWGVELSDGRTVSMDGLIRITQPDVWERLNKKIKGMKLADKNEFIIKNTLDKDSFDQLLESTIDFLEGEDVFTQTFRGRDNNGNKNYTIDPDIIKINKVLRDEAHPLADLFGRVLKLSDGTETKPMGRWLIDLDFGKRTIPIEGKKSESKPVKNVSEMTDAELTKESDDIGKIIKEREKNILNSNTPLTGSNSGVGTLTQSEFDRFTSINDELHRRSSISSEEAKRRVAEKRVARKAENQYTPEQQKQIDAINTEYSGKISEAEKSVIANKNAKDKAIAEAQDRQGLFGDTKGTGENAMFSEKEQGFEVTPERLKAIEQPFKEREDELTKQIESLKKEQQSKIGEIEKQQDLFVTTTEPLKKSPLTKEKHTYTKEEKPWLSDEEIKVLNEVIRNQGNHTRVEVQKIYDKNNAVQLAENKRYTTNESAKEWVDRRFNEGYRLKNGVLSKEGGDEYKLAKIEKDYAKIVEDNLQKGATEKAPTNGIPFKDKTYVSVDQVQDALDKGEITFEEQKPLIEQVRKFEDGERAKAQKASNDIDSRINKLASDSEAKIKKDINDKNSQLNARLFPDLLSQGNTALYKQLVQVRDKVGNSLAKQLQAGVISKNDAVRWSSKAITNLYNGLLRSQADIHGKDFTVIGDVFNPKATSERKIGKLEMSGTVKTFAPYKAKNLIDAWRGLVSNDPVALERVWKVLDPELANLKTEEGVLAGSEEPRPIVYGDLTQAEKNLYWALKEWNTWVWSTNYANGLVPTESHLKFKGDFDATGYSDYIARMYDVYEADPLLAPEMQEFISRGNSAVTGRMNTDYMKAREESNEWKKVHAIKDPAYLTAKRVMQTIQNVAIKQYMDLVGAEHPEYVKTVKKGAEVPKGYTLLSNSYSWGPFRGKAIANHIVEDLTGFYYANGIANTAYDAIKMWDRTKVNQFYKKWRTVYNPFVQLGNVTGNVFFASVNGINPFVFTKGMVDARNIREKDPGLYESLMKSGLIGDTGITGEMKPLNPMEPQEGVLSKADELATKMYVGADNLAKISAYKIFRGQGLSHQQAVRRAYDAFQNYTTVGKTWDVASKIPLIGPTYVKFQADLQRIMLNNMLTAPLTTIGTMMMIKVFGNLASALSGESEEEQEVRETRKGVPRVPIVDIPLSFKVGKSEVNVARYFTPLYIYPQGDSDMDINEMSKFMPIQLQKKEEDQLFPMPAFADATWGWVGSVLADRDFRMMSIQDPNSTRYTNPNITTTERIKNVLDFVARSQVPFYRGSEDIFKGATGQLDYYGRKRTWYQAILNNIVKIQQFDKPEMKNYIERNLSYLTSRYASLATRMGDANGELFKAVKYAQDKGLSADVVEKIYEKESQKRDKRLQKSLDEQIPVLQEIERLSKVYQKWYPGDPYIDENFENIQSGKNQRFNVLNDIDFQEKYKDEYLLLKSNGLLKRPEIPSYINGLALTEEQRKKYASDYWSEYIRQLDSLIGLTQEEFDEEKGMIVGREPSTTTPGPKEKSLLDAKASSAAAYARGIADMYLRSNAK